jgi:hypothetical protein
VEKFEKCEFGLAEFDHALHLSVGIMYLNDLAFEEAMKRMRWGLVRFSGHHGKMGFHETITRFWLLQLEQVRRECDGMSLWETVNAAIERLGRKELLFEFYSREWVMSEDAKAGWVEPDLKELPW